MMAGSNSITESKYQLKHRLIGAAVLIGLAVLIIPGLLGKSFLSSQKSTLPAPQTKGEDWQSTVEKIDLDAQPANEQEGSDPVLQDEDSGKPALYNGDTAAANKLESRTTFKPVVDESPVTAGDNLASAPSLEAKPEIVEKVEEQSAAPETATPKREVAKTPAPVPPVTKKPRAETVAKAQPAPQSRVANPAAPAPAQNKAADVGWVVRVGTFAKKQNAESVSDLLRSKGFTPKRSEIDTKVGRATRIWLGPFSGKDEANRVSSGLKEITGEKGYVTRTAS